MTNGKRNSSFIILSLCHSGSSCYLSSQYHHWFPFVCVCL